jgi:hypothetical protein
MGEVFDKGIVKKIEWIVPGNGSRAIKAVFDKRVREKVIERIRILPLAKRALKAFWKWRISGSKTTGAEFIPESDSR